MVNTWIIIYSILMVFFLVLVGNSEKDTHVRSNLYYLVGLGIWLNREQAQIGFFSIFLHAYETCSKLPSNISAMDWSEKAQNIPSRTHKFRKIVAQRGPSLWLLLRVMGGPRWGFHYTGLLLVWSHIYAMEQL